MDADRPYPLAMADTLNSDNISVARAGKTARPGLYILILIAFMVGTYLFRLRTQGIFACPAAGYATNSYLGYCNASAYGEYDHGAFWFGLEPDAQRSAANADVLFVGNSRMEFGFSANATSGWFSASGLTHYLMGFTFLENSTFAAPLLAQLRPRAKVYIIDVDQFFTRTQTTPGSGLINGTDTRQRYVEKRHWQHVQRPLCGAVPKLCGNRIAFFRSREDGHWQALGVAPEKPDVVADEPASDQDQWQTDAVLARQFLTELPVDRRCVLLTLVPSPTTRRAEAEAIAEALAMPLIAPKIDDLTTFDDTHLDARSAERWSSAFLEAAGPRIRQCATGTPAASAQ
jgi:hypothetical protein